MRASIAAIVTVAGLVAAASAAVAQTEVLASVQEDRPVCMRNVHTGRYLGGDLTTLAERCGRQERWRLYRTGEGESDFCLFNDYENAFLDADEPPRLGQDCGPKHAWSFSRAGPVGKWCINKSGARAHLSDKIGTLVRRCDMGEVWELVALPHEPLPTDAAVCLRNVQAGRYLGDDVGSLAADCGKGERWWLLPVSNRFCLLNATSNRFLAGPSPRLDATCRFDQTWYVETRTAGRHCLRNTGNDGYLSDDMSTLWPSCSDGELWEVSLYREPVAPPALSCSATGPGAGTCSFAAGTTVALDYAADAGTPRPTAVIEPPDQPRQPFSPRLIRNNGDAPQTIAFDRCTAGPQAGPGDCFALFSVTAAAPEAAR